VTMLIVVGTVWGGFLTVLIAALKKEQTKGL
jgi:hypothetical protein